MIEIILDKGLVIDAYVRVSVVGIELVTIDARIVIASVDTYLRFAEAVGRLDIADSDDAKRPTELLGGGLMESAAKATTEGAIDGVAEEMGLGGKRR